MTIQSYTKTGSDGRVVVSHYNNSTNSPKVNGKLRLRSNYHDYTHRVQREYYFDPRFEYKGAPSDANPVIFRIQDDPRMAALQNVALARFTGKVRKHNASLGVTLGSFGQSRDMIIDRSKKIASIFTKVEKIWDGPETPKSIARKKRAAIKGRASDFLEGEFGWMPLVQDIQAALGALGRDPASRWIHATQRGVVKESTVLRGSSYAYDRIITDTGEIWCTVGARCDFSNPNAFLLNRLGLLNLPGVAWDLIPWSFVVNMFTNMGQMVNSMTDFVGVTLSNGSSTRVSSIERQFLASAGFAPGQFKTVGSAQSTVTEKCRYRTLGVPTPSFQWRVPELNMELALIAISLVLQKMSRIQKLVTGSPLGLSFH